MPKLPAIHLYPGDWLRDPVSGCSLAAQGLWLRMMFIAHDSERYGHLSQSGAPIPPGSIAQRCGCTPAQYDALLAELDAAGVPSRSANGTIYSRRMVRDAQARKDAQVNGRKGGNPSLIHGVNPPINADLKMKLKMQVGLYIGEGVEGGIPPTLQTEHFLNAWGDWLDHRKEIKKPVTPTMAKKQLALCEKWGPEYAIAVIENTISHGWWGLREPESPRTANGRTPVSGVAGKPKVLEGTKVYAIP